MNNEQLDITIRHFFDNEESKNNPELNRLLKECSEIAEKFMIGVDNEFKLWGSPRTSFFIATENETNKVAGAMIVQRRQEESSMHIIGTVVKYGLQRHGISEHLTKYLIKHSKDWEKITTNIINPNESYHNSRRRMGFESDRHKDNKGGLYMTKILNESESTITLADAQPQIVTIYPKKKSIQDTSLTSKASKSLTAGGSEI